MNLHAFAVGSQYHLSFAAVHKSFFAFGSQDELQTNGAASHETDVGFAVNLHLLLVGSQLHNGFCLVQMSSEGNRLSLFAFAGVQTELQTTGAAVQLVDVGFAVSLQLPALESANRLVDAL